MKYLIFGDMHGSDLSDLEKFIEKEKPDLNICLGDFDQTQIIHQYMRLKKKKTFINVPGNHDHAILTKLGICSGTLDMQGKSSLELSAELMDDTVAYGFLYNLVNSDHKIEIFLDKKRFGNLYKTIIVHGALDGDISSYYDCPSDIKDLWLRLRIKTDFEKNFMVMENKGFNVMIRGHDHDPLYTYKDPIKGIVSYKPEYNSSYRLFKHRKHVINPGAFFNKFFAIIDTNIPNEKVPILEYKTI